MDASCGPAQRAADQIFGFAITHNLNELYDGGMSEQLMPAEYLYLYKNAQFDFSQSSMQDILNLGPQYVVNGVERVGIVNSKSWRLSGTKMNLKLSHRHRRQVRGLVLEVVGADSIRLLVLIVALASTPLWAGEPTPTPAPSPSEATLPPPATVTPKEPVPSAPPMAADVLDFTSPAYLIELANAHLKFNALDRAEPLLRTALEKSKIDAQKATICQLLASLLERKNDRKGAVAQYEAAYALVVNPNERGRLGISLADAYIRADDPDKAERFALDASKPNKLRTDDQWIQQNAIRILTQLWQGKPERIDAFAAEAEAELKKNPNNMVVLQQLVEIYTGVRHDAAKAATYQEKLCAIRPADKTLQFKLANLYQQSDQIDKAIEVNRKLVASSTARKEDQLFQVGMLMLQQGKKEEASAWMKENYAKTITSSHDFFMLAMFYEKADRPGDAASALWQIVDAPGSSTEEKADARMRIGELAFRRKDYAKAEEGAQAVLKDFAGTNLVARAKLLLKQVEAQQKKDTDSKPAAIEKKEVKLTPDDKKDAKAEEPTGATGAPPPQK